MKNSSDKTNKRYFYTALSTVIMALAMFALSLALAVRWAPYVTEIGGGGSIDFITQTPFTVGSQQEFMTAIKSGYQNVQLSEDLKAPLIMTGDSLNLINDLVIDLNGNEIQRNSRESLLNVPEGKSFTVIDRRGGGGLYNPIGTVLSVNGGDLNVYGGMFESGPRPSEYFTSLKKTTQESNLIDVGQGWVINVSTGEQSAASSQLPRLAVRGYTRSESRNTSATGNMYFDIDYTAAAALSIPRDTYCYVIVQGDTNDDFASFDTSAANFAHTYYIDGNGLPCDVVFDANSVPSKKDPEAGEDPTDVRQVMLFGYRNDIAMSVEVEDEVNKIPAPNYAAVQMFSGKLNVDVTEASTLNVGRADDRASRKPGSFYQYFGTWQTSCIYVEGGEMRVSTSGEIATVNPADLPDLQIGVENRSNSAKYGESACILSVAKIDDKGQQIGNGGTLDILKLESATSYNGSVISLSGGEVTLYDAKITKNATLSHGDDPFKVADKEGGAGVGTEFPADRQYRDAAVFLNGGTLTLRGSEIARENSVRITVNKDLSSSDPLSQGYQANHKSDLKYSVGYTETTDGVEKLSRPYNTTFGILSRGKSNLKQSKFDADHLDVVMHGAYSYGIFGTRGQMTIADGSITLDSDSHSYGIYAVNRTSFAGRAVNVEFQNTHITVGDVVTHNGNSPTYEGGERPTDDAWMSTSGTLLDSYRDGAMRAASCGIYLDSADYPGGQVTINGSSVLSREMGVAVNGGGLTFKNGCDIKAYNASAVCLSGGNILFENNGTADAPTEYNVECYLNRKGLGLTSGCSAGSTTADAAGTHAYEIYLPYQRGADGNARTYYPNENGIRVVGGTFSCKGKLNMTFRGLYNDYKDYVTINKHSSVSSYTNYDKVKIKSFAVACVNQEVDKDVSAVAANIDISYANIVSLVGGGVKVQGGTITLGSADRTADAYRNDIVVNTKGTVHLNTSCYVAKNLTSKKWQFFPNLSGGHAVIARGGNITVYNGIYTADNSNGIAASDEGGETINITVHNGKFTGNLYNHGGKDGLNGTDGHEFNSDPQWGKYQYLQMMQALGPATHYGLKVLGGANVDILGGEFGGRNGGAYIRGSSETKLAVVKIVKAKFTGGSRKDNGGTTDTTSDCFDISDYTSAYLGAQVWDDIKGLSNEQRQNLIVMEGGQTPLSVESLLSGTKSHTRVFVFYGKYTVKTSPTPFGYGYIPGGTETVFYFYNFGTSVYNQGVSSWNGSTNGFRNDGTNCKGGIYTTTAYYKVDEKGNIVDPPEL